MWFQLPDSEHENSNIIIFNRLRAFLSKGFQRGILGIEEPPD